MVQGVGKKLNTPLLFSAHLDVRPYLSSTVLQKRFTVKRPPERRKNGLSDDSDEVSVIYELYAVVCHRGNLQVRCNYFLLLSGFTVGLQGFGWVSVSVLAVPSACTPMSKQNAVQVCAMGVAFHPKPTGPSPLHLLQLSAVKTLINRPLFWWHRKGNVQGTLAVT